MREQVGEDCPTGVEFDTLYSAAQEVIELAYRAGITLGTAESCTGGMVAVALTSIPGASEVFKGSVVSYANQVKTDLLKVDEDLLLSVGAVSKEVALQMALGVRSILKTDFSVSITGIAGPDGGSAEKPVGTVWIAVAGPGEQNATLHHFSGTREQIREAASEAALHKLLLSITPFPE